MKIGLKISLFYTALGLLTTVAVISAFYLFSSAYIDRLFDSYLSDKAYITAQKQWEKDEVDEKHYLQIQKKYQELLPEADILLLNAADSGITKKTLKRFLSPQQVTAILNSKKEHLISFDYEEKHGAALYYPDNEGNFVVVVMAQNKYGNEIKEHLLLISVFLLIAGALITLLFGNIYSSHILRPLKQILNQLQKIRANRLDRRLKATGNHDELDALAIALNNMLDNLDNAFQTEKSFVSYASHELNNPLTAIQGECEISLMDKDTEKEEYEESLKRILSESRRMTSVIQQLLYLSKQDEQMFKASIQSVDIHDMITAIASTDSRIILSTDEKAKDTNVKANPYLLKAAIKNITDNALKYSEKDIEVCLSFIDGHLSINVKDYGIGIPEGEIESIQKSCFRGSNTAAYPGKGIGLNLARNILKAYNASLEITSKQGEWTNVRIVFL
ncbi:MAG: HAMP domain-containing sensor histidine kinase [Prevotellaceae bacterium]|nr:HAMP domain-containing sensor histidine kinase [Prevotellaceae bacterium]